MLARFDAEQKLTANGQKIDAAGPIDWEPGDEGKTITRIDVTFTQNGRECKAHSPSGMEFRQGRDTRWRFQMDNQGMGAGGVDAHGKAEVDDDDEKTWSQPPDGPAVSIVAP